MHRFFLPPNQCQGDVFDLGESDAHHAASVLRLKPDDELVVLNGEGSRIRAAVISLQKRRVSLRRLSQEVVPCPRCPITLVQSIAKPKAMDWILQKATELGASSIRPILTEHCVSRPTPADAESKRAGWEATVIEAAKQSNAAWIPKVQAPITFKSFLNQARPADWILVASLHPGAIPIDQALEQVQLQKGSLPNSAAFIVGPEGDFSPEELTQLLEYGASPITLGDQILRCETAALAGLTLLQHELRRSR
jgi:16S rRNA (uracil1498-N3)-methyltransferase